MIPYLVVRLLGLGLQVRIDLERERVERGSVAIWASLSLIGLALVLAGAFVDPPARNWIWLAAIAADLIAAGSGASGDGRDWDIRPAHFSERHGLFVIIALGESLIVAATAVSAADRTWALMSDVIAALVIVCLLWWTYFGWLKEAAEEGLAGRGRRRSARWRATPTASGTSRWCAGSSRSPWPSRRSSTIPRTPHRARSSPRSASASRSSSGRPRSSTGASPAACSWRASSILAATMVALALVSSREPIWLLVTVAIGLLVIVVSEARTGVDARAHDEADSGIPPSDG